MPRKWGYVLLGCAIGTVMGLTFWAKDHFATPNHRILSERPAVTQYTSHHSGEPQPAAAPAREETPVSRPALLPLNNLNETPPAATAPEPAAAPELVQVSSPAPREVPVAEAPPPVAPMPAPSVPLSSPSAPVAQPMAVSYAPATPTTIVCPWIVKLEIVEGRSRLEARTETGVYLKISCDRLQLKSPDGNIEAIGNVSFMAGSLEGSCDNMALTWSDSKINLVGKVKLKGRQEEQDVDVASDSMSFKLQPTAKARLTPPSQSVLPASAVMPAPPVPAAAPPAPPVPPPAAFPPPNFNPPMPPMQEGPPPAAVAPPPPAPLPAAPPAPLSPAPLNQTPDQPAPPPSTERNGLQPGSSRNGTSNKPGVAIAEGPRQATTPPQACVAEVVILADGTRVVVPPPPPVNREIAGR